VQKYKIILYKPRFILIIFRKLTRGDTPAGFKTTQHCNYLTSSVGCAGNLYRFTLSGSFNYVCSSYFFLISETGCKGNRIFILCNFFNKLFL